MKKIILALAFSIATQNIIFAGCGSCNVTNNKVTKPEGTFVTSIGEKGDIKGLVLASCGICNFGMKNKRCSLAIQVNEKSYHVLYFVGTKPLKFYSKFGLYTCWSW